MVKKSIKCLNPVLCQRSNRCYAIHPMSVFHWKMPVRFPLRTRKFLLTTQQRRLSLRIPLSNLFSVFHGYRKIIMGKHTFRLVRAHFHELPGLKSASNDVWSVKATLNLTRPRFVCVCFQTHQKDNSASDITLFDNVNITNIRLWLNSEVYPFENQNCDFNKKKYNILSHYIQIFESYFMDEK
ncbi:hypothetical protein HUJ05_008731 [Dendroctonus ponderosae]|nr:hypothetical protein HUJ05_008731 [Dendroctonus ponderosae]